MGNSNCGCASRKVGGKRVKSGGMSCNKTRKHKHPKKKRKSKSKKGGCNSCGCELMSGGYKYDRRSSVEAVNRLKKRVSKNTKSKGKKHSKHGKKKSKVSTKKKGRK
jgi:hypothetical protein